MKIYNFILTILCVILFIALCSTIEIASKNNTVNSPYGVVIKVELNDETNSPYKYHVNVKYTSSYSSKKTPLLYESFYFNTNVSYQIGDTVTIK